MEHDFLTSVQQLTLLQPSWTPDVRLPPVVSVLDDFSQQCFARTVGLWPVLPTSHPIDLECIGPDFLLVESAWNGNNGAWRHGIFSASGELVALQNLVQQARKRGIPTVFWNKEDPPHFEDFAPAAALFDYVFTTESSLLDNYRELAPHAEVGVLKFAASTALHRPERVDGHRAGEVCFAGQYFQHKYPERREQMDFLFDAAARFNFTIYSRMLGDQDRYAFPEKFEQFVVGSLPYAEMVNEYRRHKIFLNVNSVPSSRSMCARRVFELASCKTVVLSAESPAIRSVYDEDEVPMAANADEAATILGALLSDDAARNAMTHKAWRRTAREHTYDHRMQQIRRTLGLDWERPDEIVGLVTPSGLPHEALDVLAVELLEQVPLTGFSWVWLLDEPSWIAEREQLVHHLAARGIFVAPEADPTWWAAWHPGATRGSHYLEDMLLYASHYAEDHQVCVDPARLGSAQEDAPTTQVWSAGWLARHDSRAADQLLAAGRRTDTCYVETSGTYLVSGVQMSMAGTELGAGS